MKKSIKIVCFLLVFCLILACAFIQPKTTTSYAISSEKIEASVYGNCTETIKADSADIFVRVESADTDLSLAKEKSFNQFSALKNNLNNYEIKIDSFYTNPNIDYSLDKQIVGYYAVLNCVISLDNLENLDEIISTISSNDACISYINLKLSNADEMYLDCLVKAKQNAIENAKILLETESVNVLEVEEESRFYSSTKYMKAESVMQENYSLDIEISASVCIKCEG